MYLLLILISHIFYFVIIITVLSPYVLGLVYTIRVTRYPHHFFLTLVWRRRERDGTRASESHWSRSVFRTPCHSGARKAFHLAPPFGQKEARNEHSELGSLFTIRVTRRSRPVSTYGDNTVSSIFCDCIFSSIFFVILLSSIFVIYLIFHVLGVIFLLL